MARGRAAGRALALIAAAPPLLVPAAAPAATVTVRAADRFTDEVHYVAAPGEANRLLVSYAGDARSVTVSDRVAVITATGSCTSIDSDRVDPRRRLPTRAWTIRLER